MINNENITINFFPLEIIGSNIFLYVSNQEPQEMHNEFISHQLSRLHEATIIQKDERFWSFQEFQGSRQVSIDSKKDLNITKRYVNDILFRYFLGIQGLLLNNNFIGGIGVFEKDGTENVNNTELQKLKVFSIRCEYWESTKRFGVIVSRGRATYHTISPYATFKGQTPLQNINHVVFNNRIGRCSDFEGVPGFDDNNFYLMRSNALGNIFPLYKRGYKRVNPYLEFHKDIISFSKKYLFEKTLEDFINFPHSQLMAVPKHDLFKTPRESNLLSFKDEQKSPNVYNGLKEYGPFYVPPGADKVKFIFIFHDRDKEIANTLLSYFSKGYRGFPGFGQFIGIPITSTQVDKEKTIRYTSDNPADEVIQRINAMDFSQATYAAFYLSRIHRDELDPEKNAVYYKIKEALLKKGIVSQVIYKDNLSNQYFNFFLPNIAIALLAKLSGIPWKLTHPAVPNLIVGIGASREASNSFFGNTICFKNDGTFEEFDAFSANDVVPLGNAFKSAIQRYVKTHQDVQRLVVHFYKQMNKVEERNLLNILSDLNISIPYVVLTITDDAGKDYVIFDEDYDGLMPVSGTYVRVRQNTYVLANNERYEKSAVLKIADFPYPVKIHFSKSRDVDLQNPEIVKELIYQVYQFSRIYWRSIRQKSKPVTILYSEKIAEMARYFQDGKLPENMVSHKALWFL